MRFALGMVLLSWSVPASAMRWETPAEEAEIQSHIDKAGSVAVEDMRVNPRFTRAIRRKRGLEARMGLPRDESGNALRGPTEQELEKLHHFFSDEREDYRRSATVVQESMILRDYHYNAAIELTARYTGLGPNKKQGIVQHNAPEAARGLVLNWAPRFAPTVKSQMATWELERHPAYTGRDGNVYVRETAFKSPAVLAYALRHEAMHVNLMLSNEEFGQSKPEEERLLEAAGLAQAGELGLSAELYRDHFYNLLAMDAVLRDWIEKYRGGLRPGQNPGDFQMVVPPLRQAQIDRALAADLALFTDYLASGGGAESLESLKANGQSEFVRNLDSKYLPGLLEGWRHARQHDAESSQRKAAVSYYRIALEANQCGFHLNPDWTLSGPVSPFRIPHGYDVDVAKAGFMLMDACVKSGGEQAEPCNDSLSVIMSRWADIDFRNRMVAMRASGPFGDGQSEEGRCLYYLHENWKPRGDFEDLKEAVEKHHRIWWKEHYGGSDPPPSGGGRRERDPERPGRGYDGPCGNGGSLCGGNRPSVPNTHQQ